MSTPPTPVAPAQDAADIMRRFSWSLAALMRMLEWAVAHAPVPGLTWTALYNYMSRTRRRFEVLLHRLAAGTPARPSRLAPPRLAPPPAPASQAESAEAAPPRLRFRVPRRKAWLVKALGRFGYPFASQIAHLLDEPATAALIAGAPQVHRLLRPLCHMLGITPASIPPLPRRPRKPRPHRPRARTAPPRLTRRQREAILWYPNSEGRPMKLLPRKLPRD